MLDHGSRAAYAQALDATPDADPFCSSLVWVESALAAFAPDAATLAVRSGDTFALLSQRQRGPEATMIHGWEPLWGFACPVVGPESAAVAGRVAEMLLDHGNWSHLVLPGFGADLKRARQVATPLAQLGPVHASPGLVRCVADIGDRDSWWERRSSALRRNLRRARRRAGDTGIGFVDARHQHDLLERLARIEERSWKGEAGDGLLNPEMYAFYRRLVEVLQPEGRIRCLIAQQGGRDVGYVLGGVRRDTYRGFQISYATEVAAASVGNLLQWEQITRLEPAIDRYDLGMEMQYKQAWADRRELSVALVVERHNRGSAPG